MVRKVLASVLNNVYVNLVLGIVLVATALFEMFDTMAEEMLGLDVGVHHGILVIGALTIVRGVHELFLGLEHIERVEDAKSEPGRQASPADR